MNAITSIIFSLLASLGFFTLPKVMGLPDPKYLIDKNIPEKSLGMLYGPSGIGKSFVVIDILLSIALGKSWYGHKTVKGAVFYIVGEGGASIKYRLMAWLQNHALEPNDVPIYVRTSPVNLFDSDAVEKFIARLKRIQKQMGVPIRMVAFDTLARCSVGAEENSNTAMGKVIDNCERIQKECDVAVFLVHHTGKTNENTVRGASALYAAMDVVMRLNRAGNGLSLTIEKQKDDEEIASKRLKLVQVPSLNGRTSCVVEYSADCEKLSANNEDLGPNQKLMIEYVDARGEAGVEWGLVRAFMNEAKGGNLHSSACSETKNALIKKGLMIQKENKVISIAQIRSGDQQLAS